MGGLVFHNAYSEAGSHSAEECEGGQSDFNTDSDALDAELLELEQELSKLGMESVKRDLTDTTIAAQEITLTIKTIHFDSISTPSYTSAGQQG